MKHLWMTIGCLLAVALMSMACAADNDKVSEVRRVDSFSSIEITSVATVYFTQGDGCSLRIEGKEKFVKNTTTTVKDGCLLVGFKEKDNNNRSNGVTIYLTAPDLKRVEFTGVGSFNCEEPLVLDDVKLALQGVGRLNVDDLKCHTLQIDVEGVGHATVNLRCDDLKADLEGVGSVTLSGEVGRAEISKDGIGRVNTRNLVVRD